MFTGTYQNSIDSKNRMIVPAKFRDLLGGQCVLARGFDKCLYIYSLDEWEVLADKLRKLSITDRGHRKFIREVFSNAEECHLDAQGRILIPQKLKSYAGITKDLITMGSMDKVEIWAAEVLEDPEGENMMDDEEFVKSLDKYNI